MFLFILVIQLIVATVHGCPNFAQSPFATANKAKWTWDAATTVCKDQHLVEFRGTTFEWSGEFCTVSPAVYAAQAVELSNIFITKWYCTKQCYQDNWQVAVFGYTKFGCVHGGAPVDSENPNDIKIKCNCGDGVGEPLLNTAVVSFQQIHEEFMTTCSLSAPLTNCPAPTATATGVTLVPSPGHFVWTDGTYQADAELAAECLNPAEIVVSGAPTTTCQASGQWTINPSDAVCAIEVIEECSSLNDIKISGGASNVNWTYITAENIRGAFAIDTIAEIPCAAGFALEDNIAVTSVSLTCTLEGWTPKLPCCVPIAGCNLLNDLDLPNTEGSWVYKPEAETKKVPVDTSATILCEEGYVSSETGANNLTVTCATKWTVLGQCIVPPPPTTTTNSTSTTTTTTPIPTTTAIPTTTMCVTTCPCFREDFQAIMDLFPPQWVLPVNDAEETAHGDGWTFQCPDGTITWFCDNGTVDPSPDGPCSDGS